MAKKLDPKVAEQVMLKAGLIPLEPYKNADTKWKCKCRVCGAEVQPMYASIQQGQGGCWDCAHKKTGVSHKVTAEVAIAKMLEADLQPLEPYELSSKNWKCKCLKCGKIVYPKYNQVYNGAGGCIKCGYLNRIDPQKYSHKQASDIMKNADLKPLEPYKSARTKWKCECLVCGLVGFPMLGNIIVGQGGCTNCQNSFNYHEPSFFYVISNSKLNALKIGIGNSTITKNNRLKKHVKYKWKAEYVFDFENGFLAYEFEQTLLKYLRNKLRLLPHLTRVDMPQGGHSETMDVKKIPLVKLLDLVRKNHLGQL